MKTLYLHIGTPKTGTTSIQAFMVQNQDELNRNGYCYPSMTFRNNSDDIYRNGHFTFGYLFKKKERCYDTENQYRDAAYNKIQELFKTYDNVILSDEGIWHCGFREDCNVWERLQQEMQTHNFTTKVIVYLRRQDDFLQSWWSQKIRTQPDFSNKSWDDTLQNLSDVPLLELDYYKMITAISKYIGKENIIVRRFGRGYFDNDSLYTDFLNAVGLQHTDAYTIEEEILNSGLTKNCVEIKRAINQIPGVTKKEHQFFLDILVEYSEKKGKDTRYTMYTEEEARTLYEKYRNSNQKVAKEYLGMEQDLFEFSYIAKERWTPTNEEMPEDLISFMAESILRTRREMDALNKELTAVKNELEAQKKQSNYMLGILQHPVRAAGRKLKRK